MFRGNPNGRILVIQDEPTKDDLESGQPFTGQAGWLLKAWIQDAGISLDDCAFFTNGYGPLKDSEYEIIVPLGDAILHSYLPGSPKLNKVRGSIYSLSGIVKLIPSLHPKDVLFNRQWEYRCRSDWRKIKEQLNGREFTAPERTHNISPGLTDIKSFYNEIGPETVISIDIETWGGSIKCIGFAANERESIVIPTEEYYWRKLGDELDIHNAWDLIQKICEHPCEKVMQNGLFDAWWLEEYGISVANYIWDTLGMHHALYPRDNHSLDYLASIYTNQPYWKEMGDKDAYQASLIDKSRMEILYEYNGLDVTVTYEIFTKLKDELVQAGMLNFYKAHYAQMFQPLLSLMRTGVPVNRSEMETMRMRLLEEARELRDKASKLIGKALFTFDKTKAERDALEWYLSRQKICGDL